MPFLVKTSTNGKIEYRTMAAKPKLVGKQKYIGETMTRCLGWAEITQAEADLGPTELMLRAGLADRQREDFYAGA